MNDDSSRKLSCTIRRRKPIARRTPICWRRSTTARALITPRAATPTIRPRPMKPLISRLKVQARGDGVVRASFETASACMPFARNADSSCLARRVRIDARREREQVDRRPHAVAEGGPSVRLRGPDAGHRERRRVGEHADHRQPDVSCRSAGRARRSGRVRSACPRGRSRAAGTPGGTAEAPVRPAAARRAGRRRRARVRRGSRARPRWRAVAAGRGRRARRSCASRNARRRRGRVVLRRVARLPDLARLHRQVRLARRRRGSPTAFTPGACRERRAHVRRSALTGAASARTSKPPPNDLDVVEGVRRTSR